MAVASQQEWLLNQLQKGFGYGGFIHHFKNYVIRRDPHYLISAQESMRNTTAVLDIYERSALTAQQRQDIQTIKLTVMEYQTKADMLANDPDRFQTMSVKQLDALVKVDDEFAFQSLERFHNSLGNALINSQNRTTELLHILHQKWLWWLVGISILYWFCIRLLMKFNQTIESQLSHLAAVYELAPDAIVVSNFEGKIVECNAAFRRIFQLSDQQAVNGFSVEDFIPNEFSDKHEYVRKMFLEREQSEGMEHRNRTFLAKKLDGTVFHVDISISSVVLDHIPYAISIIHDKHKEEQLVKLASTDPLTGLNNRKAGEEALIKARYRMVRYEWQSCVLFIDIDHFKQVNDEQGHDQGDAVLKQVSSILRHHTRQTDTLARWGGDEFIILVENTPIDSALTLANHLREHVQTAFAQQAVPITLSIGITDLDIHTPLDDILEQADQALYQAKHEGRNTCMLFRQH